MTAVRKSARSARTDGSGLAGRRLMWQLAPPAAARLDRAMGETLGELAGELRSTTTRAITGGGERLRPALTMAVAGSTSTGARDRDEATLRSASAVELLHRATLVHDDLLDGSARRHGVLTINAREGAARALLTGDTLIAAALFEAAQVGRAAALVLARTLADLCRGEAVQHQQRFAADVTVPAVLTVARLKSGSLLKAAAVLGGEVAGHDAETIAALARYGTEFGVALQVVDDLFDVLADPAALGKPVGVDFTAGTVTLPAIIAMQRHPQLYAFLRPGLTEPERREAQQLLRCGRAVRVARDAAYAHADQAARELRRAAQAQPGLADLVRWPRHYVEHQFSLSALTWPEDGACCAPARRHREPDTDASGR